MTDATVLVGDVPLERVRLVEHRLEGGFVATRIPGLEADLQQRPARPSHDIRVAGELVSDEAEADLETLQAAASDGEVRAFTADISQALELTRVVVVSFWARAVAGYPARYEYELHLREAAELPPPATVEPFGGLPGIGDLGFDTDVLGDIEDLASEAAAMADAAMDAIEQLEALANLGSLGDIGGLLSPMDDAIGSASELGSAVEEGTGVLGGLLGQ